MSLDTKLEAALWYASQGLMVLPLHQIDTDGFCSCGAKGCSSPGKHPRLPNGLHGASKDPSRIRDWWRRWPEANVGIVTGRASGLVVIDVDGEAGEESIAMLEADYGPLPESWEQLTGGGGRHLVFRRPDMDKVGNRVRLAPGLDIRGDDGYIVAEPSNHVSGGAYYWEAAHHPADIPLAALPHAWLELLTEPARPGRGPVEIPAALPEGQRNDGLFRLGASMRARGLSDGAIEAALLAENQARCTPPLPPGEVRSIAQSCCRYAPGDAAAYRASRLEAAAPAMEPGEGLAQLRKLLEREPYYADPVIDLVAGMDERGNPDFFAAMELLRSQPGYRERDFQAARRKRRAKQSGLRMVEPGEAAGLPALETVLPDIPVPGLTLPQDWRMTKAGRIYRLEERANGSTATLTACPHPVFPIARLHNLDTGTEKVRIAWRRDGKWQEAVTDAAVVASRAGIVQLSNLGLQVTSESAKHLVTFLSDFATANRERLPRQESAFRMGWIGTKRFAPYDASIAYDGGLDYQGAYGAIGPEGDPAAWRQLMASLYKAPILRAALAASFAAPLVAFTGYQPFFLHLWGGSGAGKTVALKAALSVWGDPERMLKTLNSTKVGLERHAAFYHSLPVALDELQAMASKSLTMESIVYTMALGKSKGRGAAAGGVEQEQEWRTIFLTSGEEPIGQDSTQGGAINRVIELYMPPDAYEATGQGAGDVAMALLDTHGHGGRPFIEALIRETDGKRAPVLERWKRLRQELQTGEHTDKHVNSVAMLALGDYYCRRHILGAEDEAMDMAEAAIFGLDILSKLDSAQAIDPINRAWAFVGDWVQANRPRFAMGYDGAMPRLGWMLDGLVYVIPQQLTDALKDAGFSPKKIICGFGERGWIVGEANGDGTRLTIKRNINGDRPRVYALALNL